MRNFVVYIIGVGVGCDYAPLGRCNERLEVVQADDESEAVLKAIKELSLDEIESLSVRQVVSEQKIYTQTDIKELRERVAEKESVKKLFAELSEYKYPFGTCHISCSERVCDKEDECDACVQEQRDNYVFREMNKMFGGGL